MPGGVIKANKERIVASIAERDKLARSWGKAQAGIGVVVTNAFKDYPSNGAGDATVLSNSNAYYKWTGSAFSKISEGESLDHPEVKIVQAIAGLGSENETLSTAALKVLSDSKQDAFGSAFPQTYFVAPNGNDETGVAGDFSKPFTPGKAHELAVAGDTIAFLPGSYTVNTNIARNGVAYTTFGGKARITVDQDNVFLFDYTVLDESLLPVSITGDFDFTVNAAGGGIFKLGKNFSEQSYTIRWSLATQSTGVFMRMPFRISSASFEGNIVIEESSPGGAIVCDPNGCTGTGTFRLSINNKSTASYAILPYFSGFTFIVDYKGTTFGLFSAPLGAGSDNNKYVLNIKQANPCATVLDTGDYDVSCNGGTLVVFNASKISIKARLNSCTFNAGPGTYVSLLASASNVHIINDQVSCFELKGIWTSCSYSRTSTSLAILSGEFYNLQFLTSAGILKINGYVRLTDDTFLEVDGNEYLEVNGKLIGNIAGGVIKLGQTSPVIITGQVKNLNDVSPILKTAGGGYTHKVVLKNALLHAGVNAMASIEINLPDSIDLKLYGRSYANKAIAGTGAPNYVVGSNVDFVVSADVEVINQ